MRKKEFQEFGGTTACTLRAVKDCKEYDFVPIEIEEEDDTVERSRVFLGDSWFGSIKCAANIKLMGEDCILQIKTNHSRSCKGWLEHTMKDYPGGTWIVLEGHAEKEGVDLCQIGYKYNKSKVLTFVFTKGAGSTEKGVPYKAKFPDRYGNISERHVERPQLISLFFGASNRIDSWNHLRQYELALEKKWVTQCGYFRIFTTLTGMTVGDCYGLIPYITNRKKDTIIDVADELAAEMIETAQKEEQKENRKHPPESMVVCTNVTDDSSSISSPSIVPAIKTEHTMVFLKNKQIRCVWCSRVYFENRRTTIKCLECNVGFCRDKFGRSCWSHHVAHNGPPLQPKKGTILANIKRKAEEALCE